MSISKSLNYCILFKTFFLWIKFFCLDRIEEHITLLYEFIELNNDNQSYAKVNNSYLFSGYQANYSFILKNIVVNLLTLFFF
jgi:hypothetical protein